MIVSIRESKAQLSKLVGKAVAGEEIMITVRGRPAARLVGISGAPPPADMRAWAAERELALNIGLSEKASNSSSEILDDLRSDRF